MTWHEKWGVVKKWSYHLGHQVTLITAQGYNLASQGHLSSFATNSVIFTSKTTSALFKQLGVIPDVISSIISHRETNVLVGHVLRITIEDVLPLILCQLAVNLINDKEHHYLKEHNDKPALSMTTSLFISLNLLRMAIMVFETRKKIQLMIRTAVISVEANSALTMAHSLPKEPMSRDTCSALRFIKGSFRYTTAFWATEVAISCINYVPFIGHTTATLLSIHHRGRYIMTVTLPDLCNHHQMEYIKENTELALSLGIGHALLTTLLSHGIKTITYIPINYYESIIKQLMMFVSISIAANMHFPAAINHSSRQVLDPVGIYQTIIGYIFDVITIGLKEKLPGLIQKTPSNIPWNTVVDYTQRIWQHPHTKLVTLFVMPGLLHNQQAFINDPILAPNWDSLRQTVVDEIHSIESKVKTYAIPITIVAISPTATSFAIWLAKPKSYALTTLILKLVNDKEFMLQLNSLRRTLEGLKPKNTRHSSADEKTLSEPSSQLRDVAIREQQATEPSTDASIERSIESVENNPIMPLIRRTRFFSTYRIKSIDEVEELKRKYNVPT